MEEKNKKERKEAKVAFLTWFSFTLLLSCSLEPSRSLQRKKASACLKTRKRGYDEIFRKQADYNFRLDEIFRNMNSLTTKERSGNEHRQLQLLITQERDKMVEEIGTFDADSSNYALYKSILEQVSTTQETIDRYNSEARKREYNLGQLQKGRHKLR